MAKKREFSDLIRHFPENGVKWLLHHPANVRDSLRLAASDRPDFPSLDCFDFEKMSVEPTTFIREDFRHAISDLLVKLPFRDETEPGAVDVYFLIEHLSEHSRPFVFQALDYVIDAYREQKRAWIREHGDSHRLAFDPVIPVVFHTGLKPWRNLTPMVELVRGGKRFPSLIPSMSPLFLSLPSKTDASLLKDGGALGEILRLLKVRDRKPEDFRASLAIVVRELEDQLLKDDRNRLLDLLRYLMALVYHYRERSERDGLRQVVEDAVRTQSIQKEVGDMRQTIREAILEEGERIGARRGEKIGERRGEKKGLVAGKQETLLLLLRSKYGKQVTARVTKLESAVCVLTQKNTLDHRDRGREALD